MCPQARGNEPTATITTMTTEQIKRTGLELIKTARKNLRIVNGKPVTLWVVKSRGVAIASRKKKADALDIIGNHWMSNDSVKEGDTIFLEGGEQAKLNWWNSTGRMNITFSDGESLTDSTRFYRGK